VKPSENNSEWLTRKRLIDPKLKAAGWEIVPFSPGMSPNSHSCCAIEEFETANGPADYALCAEGKTLGVGRQVAAPAYTLAQKREDVYENSVEDTLDYQRACNIRDSRGVLFFFQHACRACLKRDRCRGRNSLSALVWNFVAAGGCDRITRADRYLRISAKVVYGSIRIQPLSRLNALFRHSAAVTPSARQQRGAKLDLVSRELGQCQVP